MRQCLLRQCLLRQGLCGVVLFCVMIISMGVGPKPAPQLEPDALKARPDLLVDLAFRLWLSAQNLHREVEVLESKHFDEALEAHSRIGTGKDPETGDLLVYVTGFLNFVTTEYRERQPGRYKIADPASPLRVKQGELRSKARLAEMLEVIQAVSEMAPVGALRSRLSPAARSKLAEVLAFHDLVITRQAEWIAAEQGSEAVSAGQLGSAARLMSFFPTIDGWSSGYAFPARAHATALNGAYTQILSVQRRFGRFDDQRLREVEAELAGMQLAARASERLRVLQVELSRGLWLTAQENIPKERFFVEDSEMTAAIRRSLPYETDDSGQVTFFPSSPRAMVHPDFDMDVYRESAQVFEIIAELLWEQGRFDDRESSRDLLALDFRAAHTLSELIVNYTVFLLHTAGELAREGGAESLLPQHLDTAHRSFQGYEEKQAPLGASDDSALAMAPAWQGPVPIFFDVSREVGIQPLADPLALDRPGQEGPGMMSHDAFRGAATADYDRDTYPDLFIAEEQGASRLYRNTRNGRFQDVTKAVGLAGIARVSGGYFVDYNNDGCVDLLILRNYLSSLLFRQRCNAEGDSGADITSEDITSEDITSEDITFEDVTRQAGLNRAGVPATGAVWLDYDNDGHLDLYLISSGDFEQGYVPTRGPYQNAKPNLLWRNQGDGTFVEVTEEAGVGDRGLALAATSIDFDNDGDRDLFVANDMNPDVLYENLGDGRFRNIAATAGVDDLANGMGVSVGDANQDGWMDLYVTNIGAKVNPGFKYRYPPQANRLYLNQGNGTFKDIHPEGFGPVATGWGWNGFFFDFDNDGHLDVHVTNGFRPDYLPHNSQANFLFHYDPESQHYQDVSSVSGVDFSSYSRGGVFLDHDQDGDLDMVVTGLHSPVFLRNEVQDLGHHWLNLELVGQSSNRDAFGARVKLVHAGLVQNAEVGNQGGGFISSIHGTLHFGLGSSGIVERIEIRWPSGIEQTLSDVAANQRLVIREPEGLSSP